MEFDRNLPVYELTVDEVDEGVSFVALVDVPAIEKPFMAFAKAPSMEFKKAIQAKYKFSETGERRVLTGPLMIPDVPIFRSDEAHGEYYVVFSKETIRKIVQKYFKQGNQHNVNANHSYELDGVYMFESYLTDASRGISAPMGYEGTPDGAWFGSFKVENDAVWQNRDAFKGFSVEGLFGMKEGIDESTLEEIQMTAQNVQDALAMMEESLGQNCMKNKNSTSFNMSIKTALNSLKTELQKFGSSLKLNFADYTLADGTMIRVDGDLIAGTPVYVLTDTGAIPAPDGEHEIEGVGTVTTSGGAITAIEPAETKVEVEIETKNLPLDPEVVPIKAEIDPEAGKIIADKVKEGYPEIDPAMIEEVVQKHLIAIMEELKAAYTQMGWMKEKMSMFSSQITSLKEEVKALGEKPSAVPQEFSSPHAGIISAQKAKALENFNQLTKTLKK